MNLLELLDWRTLLIASICTAFLTSAINTFQKKNHSSNLIIFISAFIVTLLLTTFDSSSKFADWQKIILNLLTTMSFAILFYNYLGKFFVDKIFEKIKEKLQNYFLNNLVK